MRKLTGFWKWIVVGLSSALVSFHIYTPQFGVLPDMAQRSVHLFFVFTLLFLLRPIKKKCQYE
jgi:TRAP-type uncharacterized transport system fused permease subunit